MNVTNRTARRAAVVLLFAFIALPAWAAAPAAAKPAPAADAKPATAAADAVAAPTEVAFDELPGHVGARIRVTTSIRTVREGELTGASSVVINVRIGDDDRSFVLSMPRETVVKVELLPAAPAADSAPAAAPAAAPAPAKH